MMKGSLLLGFVLVFVGDNYCCYGWWFGKVDLCRKGDVLYRNKDHSIKAYGVRPVMLKGLRIFGGDRVSHQWALPRVSFCPVTTPRAFLGKMRVLEAVEALHMLNLQYKVKGMQVDRLKKLVTAAVAELMIKSQALYIVRRLKRILEHQGGGSSDVLIVKLQRQRKLKIGEIEILLGSGVKLDPVFFLELQSDDTLSGGDDVNHLFLKTYSKRGGMAHTKELLSAFESLGTAMKTVREDIQKHYPELSDYVSGSAKVIDLLQSELPSYMDYPSVLDAVYGDPELTGRNIWLEGLRCAARSFYQAGLPIEPSMASSMNVLRKAVLLPYRIDTSPETRLNNNLYLSDEFTIEHISTFMELSAFHEDRIGDPHETYVPLTDSWRLGKHINERLDGCKIPNQDEILVWWRKRSPEVYEETKSLSAKVSMGYSAKLPKCKTKHGNNSYKRKGAQLKTLP
eukprot:Lankesteria_metandrocarpae@DN4989_c3_g1_i1.p1